MEISKEQLVIPVYLNEKIVLDMLAIIEDGFSKVSEVSTSYESADKINTKIERIRLYTNLIYCAKQKSRGSVPKNNDRRGLSRGNHASGWNGLDE